MNLSIKSNERLVQVTLLWVTAITVLRTLRWPNDWSEGNWLVSYSFGFVKRGLGGTLLAPFIYPNPVLGIRIISFLFMGLFLLALIWVCTRILKSSKFDISDCVTALLFLTSPYIVMSAHLMGYSDNILILVTIGACLLIKNNKIVLCSLVLSMGMLLHEIIVFVGVPSVLYFALTQSLQQNSSANSFKPVELLGDFLRRYKLLLLFPFLAFLFVFLNQTFILDSTTIENQILEHFAQFDFMDPKAKEVVADAYTLSLIKLLLNQSSYFPSRISNPRYLLNIGLPLLMLLIHARNKIQAQAYVHKRPLFTALVLICLFPLTLHFIAWDTSRVWTFPLIVALLGIWALCESSPQKNDEQESSLFPVLATIIVIGFQFFMRTPLMDKATERFSIESRIYLYAPPMFLIAYLMANRYRLTRRSSQL